MVIYTTTDVSAHPPKEEMMERTVASWIEACKNNDRLAQGKLYKKYHGKLLAMCLRYFDNREDALDALNQGFLKIFKNLDDYNPKYDFGGWAYRIVQSTAIDLVRKHLRKEKKFQLFEIKDDLKVSPNAIQNLYAQDLLELMHKLPLTTRVVFNLFALEGYSHQEIAEKLNMSVGTSKWHVNNGRKKLKKWMENQMNKLSYILRGLSYYASISIFCKYEFKRLLLKLFYT